jgi:hypothetical protein
MSYALSNEQTTLSETYLDAAVALFFLFTGLSRDLASAGSSGTLLGFASFDVPSAYAESC